MAVLRWFEGFVDDTGRFALDRRQSFIDHVKSLKGCEVVFAIKRKPKRQMRQSMRYYRGIVVPDIAEACGYIDPEDFPQVHESLAWKFLRISDHPELGYPRRRSTAKDDLTQEEMSAYIDQCITWAETSIPDCRVRRPNEVNEDEIPDYRWEDAA